MRGVLVVVAVAALALAASAANPVATVRSRAGRACMFEGGVDQLVRGAPVAAGELTEISAAYWFRSEAVHPNLYPILSYGDITATTVVRNFGLGAQKLPWVFLLDNDSNSFFAKDGQDIDQKWRHIAGTWRSSDGDTRIYINGELVASGTNTSTKGKKVPGGGRFFFPEMLWSAKVFGLVDELAAWTVRLDAADVAALYRGDTSVRSASLMMHWTCDEDGAAIADSANAAGPATLFSGSPISKVPSSCPNVNVGVSVVAVAATGPTDIVFPEPVEIKSLPASGTLSAAVGASVARVTYTPAAPPLAAAGDSFKTSYANVILQPNRPPSPAPFVQSLPETTTWAIPAAYWRIGGNPRRELLVSSDADGQPLTAKVTKLPKCGYLTQFDGTPITNLSTPVTDANLRVLYTMPEGTYGCVSDIGFDVSDEISTTALVHTFTVGLASRPPVPIPAKATTLQESQTGVVIPLNLRMDPLNLSTLTLVNAPKLGRLYDANGKPITLRPTPRTVHQWVSEIVEVSNEYSPTDYSAKQIIGEPNVWPSAGDNPLSWANDGIGNRYEHVTVRFPVAVNVDALWVYETYCPGAIYRISLFDEIKQEWVVVYNTDPRTELPAGGCEQKALFQPFLFTGFYAVLSRNVRLDLHRAYQDWPEIDAIKLVGHLSVDAAHIPGRYVRYVPDPDVHGNDSFAFEADVSGMAEEAAFARIPFYATPELGHVNVTIVHVNSRPVANSTTMLLPFGENTLEVALVLPASDEDGNSLTYTLVRIPTLGSLFTVPISQPRPGPLVANSKFTSPKLWYYYECDEPGVLDDSFIFSVSDGQAEAAATITVQVFCAHDQGYHKGPVKALVAALVVTDVVFLVALVALAAVFFIKRKKYVDLELTNRH